MLARGRSAARPNSTAACARVALPDVPGIHASGAASSPCAGAYLVPLRPPPSWPAMLLPCNIGKIVHAAASSVHMQPSPLLPPSSPSPVLPRACQPPPRALLCHCPLCCAVVVAWWWCAPARLVSVGPRSAASRAPHAAPHHVLLTRRRGWPAARAPRRPPRRCPPQQPTSCARCTTRAGCLRPGRRRRRAGPRGAQPTAPGCQACAGLPETVMDGVGGSGRGTHAAAAQARRGRRGMRRGAGRTGEAQ